MSKNPNDSDRSAPRRTLARQFAVHATVALAAVVALGAVLAITYRSAAERRGVAEGRSEAILVARTAVEPILSGRPLGATLNAREQARLPGAPAAP
jgi:hypothetical protein